MGTVTSTNNNHQAQDKTPLIVVTLAMPPDVITLAPTNIKRQPKQQPSYCKQYNRLLEQQKQKIIDDELSLAHQNSMGGDFYIRGFEIIDSKLIYDDVPIDININFEDYEMDQLGRFNSNTVESRTETPTVDPTVVSPNGGGGHKYIPICMRRRTPSPTTRQIIRVDVSVNNHKMKK